MSLDKVESFRAFIYKRWIRLFPAMALVSLLVFSTASIFHERPAGIPELSSLLPGLTFIEPSILSKILGINIKSLEGVFWSLYVEVRFYLIAGFVYYVFGRKYLVPTLMLLFLFYVVSLAGKNYTDLRIFELLYSVSLVASLKYFCWFAAGSIYYLYHQSKNIKWFYLALLISTISSLTVDLEDSNANVIIAAFVVSGVFVLNVRFIWIQKIFNNRIFLFFGFISYPLYLLHENAMISIIIKLSVLAPWLHFLIFPAVAITLLSSVAYIIAKKLEPKCREFILRIFKTKKSLNP